MQQQNPGQIIDPYAEQNKTLPQQAGIIGIKPFDGGDEQQNNSWQQHVEQQNEKDQETGLNSPHKH